MTNGRWRVFSRAAVFAGRAQCLPHRGYAAEQQVLNGAASPAVTSGNNLTIEIKKIRSEIETTLRTLEGSSF